MANLFSEKPIVKIVMLKGQDGEEKLINQADGSGLSLWVGTKAEYEAIPESELITDCIYYITDATTDDFNTRLNELDTKVDNNTTAIADNTGDIADILNTLADQTEPNKVIYGNTGDEPIASGGTFKVSREIMNKYKMFAFIVYTLDDNTPVYHTVIAYREVINSQVEATDLSNVVPQSNALIAWLYSMNIRPTAIVGETRVTMTFEGSKFNINFASAGITSETLYLYKLIGVI